MEWSLGHRGWGGAREQAIVDDCFVPMRFKWAAPGRERVELVHHAVGSLAINDVKGDAIQLTRTRRMSEREEVPVLFLNLVVAGRQRIDQAGRTQVAEPGDVMLFDGQQPFVLDAAGDCPHSLSVRLPYEEVGPAARLLLRYCVVSMLATSPLLAPLLAGLLRSCVGRAQIDHQAGAGIAEAVLSLLRALPEEDAPCLASHRGDMGRLHQCIVERHADRGLTPSEIAAALELPLRRLHALCAAQGSSCMERLYSFRLDRARSLLLQRSRDRRSIGDVAASCGFVSAAHFSRRFAQRFGYPPIALRSRG